MAKQQKRKVSTATTAKSSLPVAERSSGNGEFNPDYTYVVKNLKKIGIMAICFIVFLIVLSFII